MVYPKRKSIASTPVAVGFRYTQRETTEQCMPVGQVFETAKMLLAERHKFHGSICVNALSQSTMASLLTIEDFNTLVSKVVDDTLYYAGRW